MRINPVILRAYDIRGQYPEELTPESAERIGNAFATYVRKKRKAAKISILVARDIRATSDQIRQRLVEGILKAGADVIDMGVSTTPEFYFVAAGRAAIDAGIMITASHNPIQYNGFKFTLQGYGEIGRDQGLKEIFRDAQGKAISAKQLGRITFLRNEDSRYLARLKKVVPEMAPLRAVIDAAGGSTSFLLPRLLSYYPVLYKPLFFTPDPIFSEHSPNPLDAGVDLLMRGELSGGKYHIGVVFDADGDRAAFFDERGVRIRPDVIFALLARDRLELKRHSAFVYDVTRGRFLDPLIRASSGVLHTERVGGVFVRSRMDETRASLGGEFAGHVYHRELSNIDSALLTMLKIFRLVAVSRRPLSELVKSVTEAKIRQVSLEVKPFAAMRAVRTAYKDAITSKIDGLSVEFPRWWFSIRKSNTEPIVRITLEADTDREADQRIKELKRLLT